VRHIDELGGAVAAVEQGFVQAEIENAAFKWQQEVEQGERVIVGVNKYAAESEQPIELQAIDPAAERRQLARTATVRAERNADEAPAARVRGDELARGANTLLHPMRDAYHVRCTICALCVEHR